MNFFRSMIKIIDKLYENALLDDLEKINTDEEDVFSEIERQQNKELLALFNKIGDYMIKNKNIIIV